MPGLGADHGGIHVTNPLSILNAARALLNLDDSSHALEVPLKGLPQAHGVPPGTIEADRPCPNTNHAESSTIAHVAILKTEVLKIIGSAVVIPGNK